MIILCRDIRDLMANLCSAYGETDNKTWGNLITYQGLCEYINSEGIKCALYSKFNGSYYEYGYEFDEEDAIMFKLRFG